MIHDVDDDQVIFCEEDSNGSSSSSMPPIKRRRSNSNSEQMKLFENITRTIKENHSKKMELFQQSMQPQSELELFFASACKTVEKLKPLAQARVKFEVNKIISQAEFDHLENIASEEVIYTIQSNGNNDSETIPFIHAPELEPYMIEEYL